MSLEKKVVFLGSRVHVFNKCTKLLDISKFTFWALKGSFLEKALIDKNISHNVFTPKNKNEVLSALIASNFDILISNGCPIIFPVEKFLPSQILINIHPTYLPLLQGKTPMNGVFYDNHSFYGATMHMIDQGIDTGNTIYQEKHNLTDDIDLGLLYYLSMSLEGDVFEKGWKLLVSSNFEFKGIPQHGKSSYFNRTEEHQRIDIVCMSTDEILRKIKSFGIQSQGVIIKISSTQYRVYDAEKIINNRLLKIFKDVPIGNCALEYDSKIIVKTKDGLIKIKDFIVL